jgi:predicted ArsR family transcriptional regulator
MAKRKKAAPKPPANHNKGWEPDDVQLVIKYAHEMRKPELAKLLGRTRDSIKQKIKQLETAGIIEPVPRL